MSPKELYLYGYRKFYNPVELGEAAAPHESHLAAVEAMSDEEFAVYQAATFATTNQQFNAVTAPRPAQPYTTQKAA